MNHLTNLKSHNTDQRSQNRSANDCGMEWKLNAALIHSENQQKSSWIITAMFTFVSAMSSTFFLLSLSIITWGIMGQSLAASLGFRDRISDCERGCKATHANNFV